MARCQCGLEPFCRDVGQSVKKGIKVLTQVPIRILVRVGRRREE